MQFLKFKTFKEFECLRIFVYENQFIQQKIVSSFLLSEKPTLVDQTSGPKTAEIANINIIVTWASVTSTLPNLNVPDTYVCQCAQQNNVMAQKH